MNADTATGSPAGQVPDRVPAAPARRPAAPQPAARAETAAVAAPAGSAEKSAATTQDGGESTALLEARADDILGLFEEYDGNYEAMLPHVQSLLGLPVGLGQIEDFCESRLDNLPWELLLGHADEIRAIFEGYDGNCEEMLPDVQRLLGFPVELELVQDFCEPWGAAPWPGAAPDTVGERLLSEDGEAPAWAGETAGATAFGEEGLPEAVRSAAVLSDDGTGDEVCGGAPAADSVAPGMPELPLTGMPQPGMSELPLAGMPRPEMSEMPLAGMLQSDMPELPLAGMSRPEISEMPLADRDGLVARGAGEGVPAGETSGPAGTRGKEAEVFETEVLAGRPKPLVPVVSGSEQGSARAGRQTLSAPSLPDLPAGSAPAPRAPSAPRAGYSEALLRAILLRGEHRKALAAHAGDIRALFDRCDGNCEAMLPRVRELTGREVSLKILTTFCAPWSEEMQGHSKALENRTDEIRALFDEHRGNCTEMLPHVRDLTGLQIGLKALQQFCRPFREGKTFERRTKQQLLEPYMEDVRALFDEHGGNCVEMLPHVCKLTGEDIPLQALREFCGQNNFREKQASPEALLKAHMDGIRDLFRQHRGNSNEMLPHVRKLVGYDVSQQALRLFCRVLREEMDASPVQAMLAGHGDAIRALFERRHGNCSLMLNDVRKLTGQEVDATDLQAFCRTFREEYHRELAAHTDEILALLDSHGGKYKNCKAIYPEVLKLTSRPVPYFALRHFCRTLDSGNKVWPQAFEEHAEEIRDLFERTYGNCTEMLPLVRDLLGDRDCRMNLQDLYAFCRPWREEMACSPARQALEAHADEIRSLFWQNRGVCSAMLSEVRELTGRNIGLHLLQEFCAPLYEEYKESALGESMQACEDHREEIRALFDQNDGNCAAILPLVRELLGKRIGLNCLLDFCRPWRTRPARTMKQALQDHADEVRALFDQYNGNCTAIHPLVEELTGQPINPITLRIFCRPFRTKKRTRKGSRASATAPSAAVSVSATGTAGPVPVTTAGPAAAKTDARRKMLQADPGAPAAEDRVAQGAAREIGDAADGRPVKSRASGRASQTGSIGPVPVTTAGPAAAKADVRRKMLQADLDASADEDQVAQGSAREIGDAADGRPVKPRASRTSGRASKTGSAGPVPVTTAAPAAARADVRRKMLQADLDAPAAEARVAQGSAREIGDAADGYPAEPRASRVSATGTTAAGPVTAAAPAAARADVRRKMLQADLDALAAEDQVAQGSAREIVGMADECPAGPRASRISATGTTTAGPVTTAGPAAVQADVREQALQAGSGEPDVEDQAEQGSSREIGDVADGYPVEPRASRATAIGTTAAGPVTAAAPVAVQADVREQALQAGPDAPAAEDQVAQGSASQIGDATDVCPAEPRTSRVSATGTTTAGPVSAQADIRGQALQADPGAPAAEDQVAQGSARQTVDAADGYPAEPRTSRVSATGTTTAGPVSAQADIREQALQAGLDAPAAEDQVAQGAAREIGDAADGYPAKPRASRTSGRASNTGSAGPVPVIAAAPAAARADVRGQALQADLDAFAAEDQVAQGSAREIGDAADGRPVKPRASRTSGRASKTGSTGPVPVTTAAPVSARADVRGKMLQADLDAPAAEDQVAQGSARQTVGAADGYPAKPRASRVSATGMVAAAPVAAQADVREQTLQAGPGAPAPEDQAAQGSAREIVGMADECPAEPWASRVSATGTTAAAPASVQADVRGQALQAGPSAAAPEDQVAQGVVREIGGMADECPAEPRASRASAIGTTAAGPVSAQADIRGQALQAGPGAAAPEDQVAQGAASQAVEVADGPSLGDGAPDADDAMAAELCLLGEYESRIRFFFNVTKGDEAFLLERVRLLTGTPVSVESLRAFCRPWKTRKTRAKDKADATALDKRLQPRKQALLADRQKEREAALDDDVPDADEAVSAELSLLGEYASRIRLLFNATGDNEKLLLERVRYLTGTPVSMESLRAFCRPWKPASDPADEAVPAELHLLEEHASRVRLLFNATGDNEKLLLERVCHLLETPISMASLRVFCQPWKKTGTTGKTGTVRKTGKAKTTGKTGTARKTGKVGTTGKTGTARKTKTTGKAGKAGKE